MPIALRLQPSIPMICSRGKGRAIIMLDYSEDHSLYWVIVLDSSGEIWTVRNEDVRVRANETLCTACAPL